MSLKWISSLKQATVPDIHVVFGEKFLYHITLPCHSLPSFSGCICFPCAHINLLILKLLLASSPLTQVQRKGTSTMGPLQITVNSSLFSEPLDWLLGIGNILALKVIWSPSQLLNSALIAQTAIDNTWTNECSCVLIKLYLQNQQQAGFGPWAVVCWLLI